MQTSPSNIEDLTFGVEIETTIPTGSGIQIGGYHSGRPVVQGTVGALTTAAPTFDGAHWKAESDASITVLQDGHRACEFVSPILRGEAGVRHLVEFMNFLRQIGATVNRSCGFHVHVGVSGAAGGHEVTDYIDRLARLTAFNTKALYAQTGTLAREKGHYCAPLNGATKQAVKRLKRTKSTTGNSLGNRYQLLNLTNLPRTGTVEFRCFAGTLNVSKALLHVFSVLAICIIARKAKTPSVWDNRPLSGTKAITNFLKVRPMLRIVGGETFTTHYRRMLAKAIEMAGKYDLAQAAADAATLTGGSKSQASH